METALHSASGASSPWPPTPCEAAPDERGLLSRARGGDRDAQARLYEVHICGSAAIRGLLRRVVPSESEREDFLHEIFLAAIQGGGEFRGEALLSTYFFRIAQLTVFNAYRAANTEKRGGHVRVVQEAEWSENAALEPSSPPLEYEEVEVRLALDRLMEGIPEAYRLTLRLRIIDELDCQEIADRLAIPINTVSTRIFKGKAALAKLLSGSGFKINKSQAGPACR